MSDATTSTADGREEGQPAADGSWDSGSETGPGGARRLAKAAVVAVLALLWVRLVLFGWLFPMIERNVDSPEIGTDGDPAVEVDSLAPWSDLVPTTVVHA